LKLSTFSEHLDFDMLQDIRFHCQKLFFIIYADFAIPSSGRGLDDDLVHAHPRSGTSYQAILDI
jgi:hypothetical protein